MTPDPITASEELERRRYRPARILVPQIINAVGDRYHVSRRSMLGRHRLRSIVRARQAAMYLARRLTKHSYAEIGRRFGERDHSTVIHACRAVEHRIFRNPKTEQSIASLIDRLTGVGE